MKAPDGRTVTNPVMTVTRHPNFWSVKLTLEVRKIKFNICTYKNYTLKFLNLLNVLNNVIALHPHLCRANVASGLQLIDREKV